LDQLGPSIEVDLVEVTLVFFKWLRLVP